MLRRRMMLSSQEQQDYIKDGLVFHLDGLNKGNNPSIWEEIINKIPFQIQKSKVLKNGVEFTSEHTSRAIYNWQENKKKYVFSDEGTIEIVTTPNYNGVDSSCVMYAPSCR